MPGFLVDQFFAEMGFGEQWILLANSILERISSEVVIERESNVGAVDRLGVHPHP
jgi:hypothetical protein